MWYAIVGLDVPNSLEKRKSARAGHLARLQLLQNDGRLLLAGPFPSVDAEDPGLAGFTGSLIVAEFPSLESAQFWAKDDPYLAAGVYADVVVKPFKKVFPA
ncbi:MAG: YciI family protein [Gallionella sp.]